MLQVKNLSITHKKDFRVILKDFSFVLNPGDKAVIIGEEGNGKSTLLKWIYEPDMIEPYAEAEGECICTGERLGYLPQELPEEEKEKTVYEFFCAENSFFDLTPKELMQLAGKLHIEPDFFYRDQKMRTLSGGEKVKAQMARILTAQPTILLLDEPSNDIDIETLEWLEGLIAESRRPVMFISHDETLIERTANTVIHIEQLKRKTESHYTVARLPYRRYMEERSARLADQEQQALNERREERKRQEKFRRIQQKVENDLNSVSRQDPHGGYLLKKKMKAVKSLERRYEREAQDMTQRPETEDAIFFKIGENVRMPAGKTVLEFSMDELLTPDGDAGQNESNLPQTESRDGNSMPQIESRGGNVVPQAESHGGSVPRTESCGGNVVPQAESYGGSVPRAESRDGNGATWTESHGGNGNVVPQTESQAERRLLARNIFLRIRGGEKVCIIGQNGVGKTTLLKQIAKEMLARQDIRACYMPQNYDELLDMEKTPVDYLAVTGSKEESTRIRTWLGSLKFTADEMSHPLSELSGGQKAKVLLLRMSLSGADVLILDEPTRNFSPLSGPVIRKMLQEYEGAILSISHDRKYIGEVCTTVYRLTADGLEAVE